MVLHFQKGEKMSEIINIEGEIGALEREYAARRAELEELANAQRRAVEQSAWAAQKRAAEAAVEAARVAKLDAWRNGALAVATKRYAALRAAYDAWLVELKQWESVGHELAARHAEMSSEVHAIEAGLESTTLKSDWMGTFKNDNEMITWLDAEIKNALPENWGLEVPVNVQFKRGQNVNYIRTETLSKMAWAAKGKANQQQAFTQTDARIRATTAERKRVQDNAWH